MGFGAMFLGFMFLYDFQLGLRLPGSDSAYAMLDVFPDPVGWILLLVGLGTLSKKAEGFELLKKSTFFFLPLSILTFVKDTFLFSSFFSPQGEQSVAGSLVDLCEHLLILGFVYVLFQKTSALCRKKGEDKLSRFHALLPRFALTEGVLFLLSTLLRYLPLPQGVLAASLVLSRLDFLFWVVLIWLGAIALVRALVRVSD